MVKSFLVKTREHTFGNQAEKAFQVAGYVDLTPEGITVANITLEGYYDDLRAGIEGLNNTKNSLSIEIYCAKKNLILNISKVI